MTTKICKSRYLSIIIHSCLPPFCWNVLPLVISLALVFGHFHLISIPWVEAGAVEWWQSWKPTCSPLGKPPLAMCPVILGIIHWLRDHFLMPTLFPIIFIFHLRLKCTCARIPIQSYQTYNLGRGADNKSGNSRWYLPWRGEGGSRGGLECHIPILKNDFF